MITVINCSVCKGTHRNLVAFTLSKPVIIRDVLYTRYVVCPVNKKKVYLKEWTPG